MSGIVVIAVLALVIIAALEASNRRHADGPTAGLRGSWVTDDRDLARSKLDLLALGGKAEPFTHKPFSTGTMHDILSAKRARHFNWYHGRHAA